MASPSAAYTEGCPEGVLAQLGAKLRFEPDQVLGQTGSPIKSVFLVQSGLVSIVIPLEDGHAVEAAMTGPGMVLGGASAFGSRMWKNTAVGQMSGLAREIPAREFAAAVSMHLELRDLVFRSEQAILVQAQQAAACNARHRIHQRLCTWLLRANDISGAPELPFTQEFLASMLGSQRAGVSTAAAALQKEKLVSYRRGRIRITDRKGLEHRACECYRAVEERLMEF